MSVTGQMYDYHIACINEEGQKFSGVCDKDTHFCLLENLKPARKHEVSLAVCYEPDGGNAPPVCGSNSPVMTDWTRPMGTSFNVYNVYIAHI